MPRSTRSTPTATPPTDETPLVTESPASPLSRPSPNPNLASATVVGSATAFDDRAYREIEAALTMAQHVLDLLQFHRLLMQAENCLLLHKAPVMRGSGGSACRPEAGSELQKGRSRLARLRGRLLQAGTISVGAETGRARDAVETAPPGDETVGVGVAGASVGTGSAGPSAG